MSLLESLGYSSDKNVVILDIGAAYTKCGLAGETGPRCIVPSEVKSSKLDRVVKLWANVKEDDLFQHLKDFLFDLYFRQLLLSPKNRRVVVCESMLCPSSFRETLAEVLFKHFEVASVFFTSGHIATMLTLGTHTGLVMDIGYTEALVIPVYHGMPILKALTSVPLASKAIHSKIEKMLLDTAMVTTETKEEVQLSSLPGCLNDQILEDIKVRCCFVTSMKRAKQIQDVFLHGADKTKLPKAPPSVQYPLDGGKMLQISGEVREYSCEVMFEQDHEEVSITTALLDSILKCPIDIRHEMSANIVITGGTAMLPGFHHRVGSELYHLLQKPKYKQNLCISTFKFHKLPAKENYAAWLGGAMLGALDTLPGCSVTKETYMLSEKLTDWCCVTEAVDLDKDERFPVKMK